MVRFFNDVSLTMRYTIIHLLGMVSKLTYVSMMWLATDEDRRVLKEMDND